jgi:hypothetical protein
MTPLASDTSKVNKSTPASTPISLRRGRPGGSSQRSADTPQKASASPSAPPASDSIRLSVINCRTS